MKSLTKEKRYDMIDAFNSTSRYLADLLNTDNIHFEQMVHRIYPAELQLHKSNRKAMNRNWSNQKANPTLKTRTGNK